MFTFGEKRVNIDNFFIMMAKKYYSKAITRIEESHQICLLILVCSYIACEHVLMFCI